MSVFLECIKTRRTGFLPAFLGGGILSAIVPVANMAVRSEMYRSYQGKPLEILLSANWQLMAMLNVLLVTAGACLLYHTEYADNALQKMKSLPVGESALFFGKMVLLFLVSAMMLAMEAGAIAFCACHWFEFEIEKDFFSRLCENFGSAFVLMLPCIILSLIIAETSRNMWVSLGIGVVCVFTATMLPADNFILSLFPFAIPFQTFAEADGARVMQYFYGAAAESVFLGLAELIWIKIRRAFA